MILPTPRSTLFPYTTLFRSKLIQGDPQMNRQTTTTKKQHFQGAFLFSLAFAVAYPIPPAKARLNKKDRKSTRLNSSHTVISYAVFCLKKKKSIISGVN